MAGVYEPLVDRQLAHEMLAGRVAPAGGIGTLAGANGRSMAEEAAAATSALRSIGSAVGREIIRGVLGPLLGGSHRR